MADGADTIKCRQRTYEIGNLMWWWNWNLEISREVGSAFSGCIHPFLGYSRSLLNKIYKDPCNNCSLQNHSESVQRGNGENKTMLELCNRILNSNWNE